jgi:hypothetical protein
MVEMDPERAERMLNRFRRLMLELERGSIVRNSFEPWEVDVLTDIVHWSAKGHHRKDALRQYRRVVEKQIESGLPPVRLSVFLAEREQARELRAQQRTTRLP